MHAIYKYRPNLNTIQEQLIFQFIIQIYQFKMQQVSEEEQRLIQPAAKHFQNLQQCMKYFFGCKLVEILFSLTVILSPYAQISMMFEISMMICVTAWGILFIKYRKNILAIPSIRKYQYQIKRTLLDILALAITNLQLSIQIRRLIYLVGLCYFLTSTMKLLQPVQEIGSQNQFAKLQKLWFNIFGLFGIIRPLLGNFYLQIDKQLYADSILTVKILLIDIYWIILMLLRYIGLKIYFREIKDSKDRILKELAVYGGYWFFFVAHRGFYFSNKVYTYIFLTMTAIYYFLCSFYIFSDKGALLFDYHQTKRKSFVQLNNGKFVRINLLEKRQHVKKISFNDYQCIYCEKRAKVLHDQCGKLLMCFNCYQKNVVKKEKIQICPICKQDTSPRYTMLCSYGKFLRTRGLFRECKIWREDWMYAIQL